MTYFDRAVVSLVSVMMVICSHAMAAEPAQPPGAGPVSRITLPGPRTGVAWGFLYGYPGTKAEVYLPQLREMNSGFTKVYLFWSQIEPEQGKFDWTATDKFVEQLHSPDEGLISIFCSSKWATRRSMPMLPPSPARNIDDYYRFVHTLVSRYKGKVRYWQNDCEPNNAVYWSGTAEEFVVQLKVFYKAVKDADPEAVVICGGYDGLFNPPGKPPKPGQEAGLAFFDKVLEQGKGSFDLFDLRLYANPYDIPDCVQVMRDKMQKLGYQTPIVCTEYNGPGFFQFPVNRKYVGTVMEWSQAIVSGGSDTMKAPAVNPISDLYAHMSELAPQTQMFMAGCPKALDEKFYRIQARDMVMRNVLAFSAGVQKTIFWDLWHDVSNRDDLMQLMYSKHRLMEYEDGVLKKHLPGAAPFARMAAFFEGVEQVTRVEVQGQPAVMLFEVQRAGRPTGYVVWQQRDTFTGEDEPSVPVSFRVSAPAVKAIDVLGQTPQAQLKDGLLTLSITDTPVFIEPQ